MNIAKAVSQRQNESAQGKGNKMATMADTQTILKRSNGVQKTVVTLTFGSCRMR